MKTLSKVTNAIAASYRLWTSKATGLDKIIPAEIKDDDFYHALFYFAKNANIKTILEIGASSGAGSTEALVRGIKKNRNRPILFTIEVSRARFKHLSTRYARDPQVRPYNVSSVGLADFPSESMVREFYRDHNTVLNDFPIETILGWLRQDIAYIRDNQVTENGIALIKAENNVETFDFVLIDGSEFTGSADLELIYGSPIIALDDINAYKNFANHQLLYDDPLYSLVVLNMCLRNGYSIFTRQGVPNVLSC